MTTLIVESEVAAPVHSLVTLEDVESGVIRARRRLLRHLESLPEPFDSLAVKFYQERLRRAGHRPMLGEYAPFLLRQVFGASQGTVEAICLPWFVLYAYTLSLDDVLDRIEDASPVDVILSQVLLDSALLLWKPRFDSHGDLWDMFLQYRTESAVAIVGEATASRAWLQSAPNLSQSRHILMGQKAALVKLLAVSLSLDSRSRLLNSEENTGIDNVCAGIQLLDDITDYLEDYHARHYTYPLCLSLRWLYAKPRLHRLCHRSLKDEEIRAVVTLSGSITHIAVAVGRHLADGMSQLSVNRDSPLGRYLHALIGRTSGAAANFRNVSCEQRAAIDEITEVLGQGSMHFSQMVANPPYAEVWTRLSRCVESLPAASN